VVGRHAHVVRLDVGAFPLDGGHLGRVSSAISGGKDTTALCA
jgi:hypothetical protein